MRSMTIALGILLALFALGQADWVSVGPEGGPIYTAAVTGSPPTLYAASTNYNTPILRSTDGGANWTPHGANLGNYPWQLVPHPTDPNTLYGVISTIFYRTTNGGESWTQTSLGPNTIGYDLAVNPRNPLVMYAGGYRYDGSSWKLSCAKTTDGGLTWNATQLDTATPAYGYSCAIDPVDTNVVYVGGYAGSTSALFKSTDCGATWTSLTLPANLYYVYSIHVSPLDHNLVFAGTLYGVCRSTDAGQTWTRQSTNNYNYRIVSAPDEPGVMYSAAYTNLYRSLDTGKTWTAAGPGIGGTSIRTVLAVPGENGTVYCGSTGGMYKSTDYGATWTEVNRGILIGKIAVVAMPPGASSTVYAEFVDNDIFKTTDDGLTWTPQNTPLSCGNVCNIAFDYNNPQRIWMLEASG